jgi:hypothetical protein
MFSAYDRSRYVAGLSGEAAGSFPGWQKAGIGHGEVRNFDFLELDWRPSKGNYCYSRRSFCVESDLGVLVSQENYDNSGMLWKPLFLSFAPVKYRYQTTLEYND